MKFSLDFCGDSMLSIIGGARAPTSLRVNA